MNQRLADNLHEKNYFVCSGIWYDIGTFQNMDRLILVVREDEVAYIEGYIDNGKSIVSIPRVVNADAFFCRIREMQRLLIPCNHHRPPVQQFLLLHLITSLLFCL